MTTSALIHSLGSITITSPDVTEFNGRVVGSGATRSSPGASTHFPKSNGVGINFSNWRKRVAPAPPVVEDIVPSLHQIGKAVVRVEHIEQERLAGGRKEGARTTKEGKGAEGNEEGERKATGAGEAEGWGVEGGKVLAAKLVEEQKLEEGETTENSIPNEVRDVLSRNGHLKIHTFIAKTHPGPPGLSGEIRVQPPVKQQHSPHLPPPIPPSLCGDDLPQQLSQSYSCGSSSVHLDAQDAGVIEEAPV